MSGAKLAVIGRATVDYLYVTEAHPIEDTENYVLAQTAVIGGSAGRAAVAAGRLGSDVHLLAMIGTGTHADLLKAQFADEPVTATWIQTSDGAQHSIVLLSERSGLRTTICTPQPPATAEALELLPDLVLASDVVLLDCTDEPLTRATLAAAKAAGVTVVMDTGPFEPWTDDVLPEADHLIMPQHFLRQRFPEVADVHEAARQVFELYAPTTLGVTQGSDGGFWIDASGYHPYAALPVDAVDTCGAGDTFHGAYAWAIANAQPIDVAFEIAAWAAGRKCAQLGNGSIPHRAELDAAFAGKLKVSSSNE